MAGALKTYGRLAITSPSLLAACYDVKGKHLTYLSSSALAELALSMREVEQRQLPGIVIETGTALGGSAIVLARAKRKDRAMRVYDMFGMIPPPTEKDGADVHARYELIAAGKSEGLGGDTYYGYRDDLLGQVRRSFADLHVPTEANAVTLCPGLFQDTLSVDESVALAHLDGDWYESTMTCLERIAPHLVPGGRLVIDDYADWSGCRQAVDEYFADRDGFRFENRSRLHIVKE